MKRGSKYTAMKSVTLRMPADMISRMKASGQANSRTLSQEIRHRLGKTEGCK